MSLLSPEQAALYKCIDPHKGAGRSVNRWIMDVIRMYVCLVLAARLWQYVQGDDDERLPTGAYLRALFSGKVFHPFLRNEYVRPFARRSYYIFVIPSTIILLIIWVMYIVQLVRRILWPVPIEDLYARIMAAVSLGYMLYTGMVMLVFIIIWEMIARKTDNTIIRRGEKYHDEKHRKS